MSKLSRHSAIRDLVSSQPVSSQEDLRRRLYRRGHRVTQATLSRDIHELRLVKTPDGYKFPQGEIPDAFLPSIERLKSETERAGMTFTTARMFGPDYARTLHEWEVRFERAWNDIKSETFDARFRRLWLYYLAYCQAGFRTGRVNVGHFVLTK